jgi:tRNA G10  N-methylase Trm11
MQYTYYIMQSLVILGRQPALGLAELESLYGADVLHPAEPSAALLDVVPSEVDFDRLGGSLKLCKVLTTLDSTNWGDIEAYLLKSAPKHASFLPEGKLKLGISAYGLRVTTQRIQATGLSLKKVLKQSGRSVRLVPNSEPALNSASVLHNNLTGDLGWELVFLRSGGQTIVGQTVAEQDINSYTVRDRDRPMRDARVGMLPPKLAQIIINLTRPTAGSTVLDPFCGTGVLLQEALLMGFGVYGSDLEPRMIEYSRANLDWLLSRSSWLSKHMTDNKTTMYLNQQDATSFKTEVPVAVVACETYLGKPITSPPPNDVLNQTAADCNLIIKKFLQQIHPQLSRGSRLCLAVPAWQVGHGHFKHLPFLTGGRSGLDQLRELGYNRISFEHARTEDLIYFRADQVVARELLVLEKL